MEVYIHEIPIASSSIGNPNLKGFQYDKEKTIRIVFDGVVVFLERRLFNHSDNYVDVEEQMFEKLFHCIFAMGVMSAKKTLN